MKLLPGDHAQAEALRIALELVKARTSSRYHLDAATIGETARKILDAMVGRAALQEGKE